MPKEKPANVNMPVRLFDWIEKEYLKRRDEGNLTTKKDLVAQALEIGLAKIAPETEPPAEPPEPAQPAAA